MGGGDIKLMAAAELVLEFHLGMAAMVMAYTAKSNYLNSVNNMYKSNYFCYNIISILPWKRGGLVSKRKNNNGVAPENRTATEFLRGQASKIFDEVAVQDKVVIVNKHSKPQSVIISYERYKKLKYEEGVDI